MNIAEADREIAHLLGQADFYKRMGCPNADDALREVLQDKLIELGRVTEEHEECAKKIENLRDDLKDSKEERDKATIADLTERLDGLKRDHADDVKALSEQIAELTRWRAAVCFAAGLDMDATADAVSKAIHELRAKRRKTRA